MSDFYCASERVSPVTYNKEAYIAIGDGGGCCGERARAGGCVRIVILLYIYIYICIRKGGEDITIDSNNNNKKEKKHFKKKKYIYLYIRVTIYNDRGRCGDDDRRGLLLSGRDSV